MKGDKKVIERLNEALFLELGAVNQYWVHYRLLEDWGYTKLAKKERAESIEEMHHADRLVARIIFLEGHPNLQTLAPLRIGQNVKEVLEADLAGEYDARTAYKKSRDICHDAGDYVSMKLFEELLGGRGRSYRLPRNTDRPARENRREQIRPAQRRFRQRSRIRFERDTGRPWRPVILFPPPRQTEAVILP
ncbi:bacterioferritin [Rhizobium beringeri]